MSDADRGLGIVTPLLLLLLLGRQDARQPSQAESLTSFYERIV
jgi:hypothetical protein